MEREFGELLRQSREDAGLSQNALAREAGLNATHLNRLEASKQGPPRMATVLKLVKGLGLSLSDEKGQQLLAAAGHRTRANRRPPSVYNSPLRVTLRTDGRRHLEPVLRELKLTLLRAVDLIGELEELVNEEESEQ
jgi:transcriptional regulator with XRE-family HTH domain